MGGRERSKGAESEKEEMQESYLLYSVFRIPQIPFDKMWQAFGVVHSSQLSWGQILKRVTAPCSFTSSLLTAEIYGQYTEQGTRYIVTSQGAVE